MYKKLAIAIVIVVLLLENIITTYTLRQQLKKIHESQAVSEAASQIIVGEYLKKATSYDSLPNGCYTIEVVLNHETGSAIVRRSVPTGDIMETISGIPPKKLRVGNVLAIWKLGQSFNPGYGF